MHPRNLPAVDPLAVLDAATELDGLVAGVLLVLLLPALDVLLPHAAISSVAVAPAATVATNEVCFIRFPPTGTACRRPGLTGALPSTDCPEIISPAYPAIGGSPDCGHLVAESRSEIDV
jgi:hypothetical protein